MHKERKQVGVDSEGKSMGGRSRLVKRGSCGREVAPANMEGVTSTIEEKCEI